MCSIHAVLRYAQPNHTTTRATPNTAMPSQYVDALAKHSKSQSEFFMIGTNLSWRTDIAIVAGTAARKPEMVAPLYLAGTLQGRRNAITKAEPEDAKITGMTRSLDRRLLALNLKPVAHATGSTPTLKVA
jgi:hypothetical protein